MLKDLYDRAPALADGHGAPSALRLVAVAESSFFPIPPDLLLVPLSSAERGARVFTAAGLLDRLGTSLKAQLERCFAIFVIMVLALVSRGVRLAAPMVP